MTGEDVASFIELRLYDNAGVEVDVDLSAARSIQIVEELSADGSASFQMPLDTEPLLSQPDLLESGFCKASVVQAAGEAPAEVFAWVLQPTAGQIVGEAGSLRVTSTGSGLRTLLLRAVIFPEDQHVLTNSPDARSFGWMSSFFDDSSWDTPISLGRADTISGPYKPIPNWPDPGALRITTETSSTIGDESLYRASFTITDTQATVRVYYTADDTAAVYLDGVQRGDTIPTDENAFRTPYFFDVTLRQGLHQIAVETSDVYGVITYLLCAVYKLNSDGTLGARLLHTDTSRWVCHKVTGGTRPGVTAAAIIRQLIEEGQARDVAGFDLLTLDFTDTVGSDGVAFTDVQEKAWPTFTTTVLDVVQELEEVSIDLRILPDFTVQVFVSQGEDKSDDVILEPGANLTDCSYSGFPLSGTRAIVRALKGWTMRTDTAAETDLGGRWELGVSSGVSGSIQQADLVGDAALENGARARYVYTGVVKAREGAVPGLDFTPGDTITSLARSGMAPLRTLSIAYATPEATPGPVACTVELDEP